MLNWQADAVLPARAMNVIGAVRVYAQRMQFFLGVPNTLMIAVLFYNDSAAIQGVFPTVWHWMGFILGVIVPVAIAVDRVLLHPAEIMYNQFQNGRESRSPNYRETMENQRRIDELHARLDRYGVPRTDGGEDR